MLYKYVLMLHVVSATVWTGGHLVLAITILPKALRERSVDVIRQFEMGYERIGIPALIIQVLSGFWLAYRLVPDVSQWVLCENVITQLITIKIGLLLLTMGLALDARLRIIPNLHEGNLKSLAYHIVPVTIVSVLFIIIGVAFRTGGLF
ncbi:MAG: CopD family protein [Opitutaceae bacterium]|nr:CopD family protein [Opitutaceae bacterium]